MERVKEGRGGEGEGGRGREGGREGGRERGREGVIGERENNGSKTNEVRTYMYINEKESYWVKEDRK